MSPVASGARSTLLVQAAVTLLFGLLRPGASGAWTVATVAVAVVAVGLAAAMQPTPAMRTAVLGFEGLAIAFGALGLVAGHYVPGTIIGISLLIRLAQTSTAAFVAVPQPQPFLPPPADPAAPTGAPWGVPPVGAVAPWAVPAPAPAAPASPWVPPSGPPPAWPPATGAPAPVQALQPAFVVPSAGTHPAGRTVLPEASVAPLPAEPAPVVPAQVAPPAASPLEQAARELVAAPAAEPAAPAAPEPPRSAPACMTILPT